MSINRIQRKDVESFQAHLKWLSNTQETSNALDYYQEIAGQSAIYPGKGTPLGLAYVGLKLNGEAGEFAEHVGKAMRDDALLKPVSDDGCEQLNVPSAFFAGELTQNRRASLIKELGDVLWYVQAAARELDLTLGQVALINLHKLCDRGERNQLQGSGDER